jgi:transcription-repair coupling factor (superfamily II helicase)
MLNINFENNKNYSLLKQNLLSSKSFAITGLTSFLRLLLLQKISESSNKGVLFIVSNEQNALKYQNDLKKLFNIDAEVFPYQNVSMYESVSPNLYDYTKQIEVLNSGAKNIIIPVKAFLEKFPDKEFFRKNSINLKIGDEIDTKEFAQKLVNLGYKRSTMVNDISEFSIRGDIIDVFSLDENPIRIELWGDEIVDLRYFNNETQKSLGKASECVIKPVYKFVLNGKWKMENGKEIFSKVEQEGYFEGIEVYQNYFNDNLVSIFDYFRLPFTDNRLLIFDEMSEIFSKYEFIADNYQKQ